MLHGLGRFSPTWEGTVLGVSHCLRLLTIFVLLDLLVLALDREPQLAGIHGLLRPFGCLGLDAQRTTVRLGLTLQAMERPLAERGRLRDLLAEDGGAPTLPSHFQLDVVPLGGRDIVLLLSGIILMACLWRFA
jgi:hypothetical protein